MSSIQKGILHPTCVIVKSQFALARNEVWDNHRLQHKVGNGILSLGAIFHITYRLELATISYLDCRFVISILSLYNIYVIYTY